MSALNEFKKLLSEANELQKKTVVKLEEQKSPIVSEQITIEKKVISEESVAEKAARYLNTNRSKVPAEPENIESQRWEDPLAPVNQKFVTFKEMNDHYGQFLQRIQQQMGTMGGGGEVKFARLDDINTSGAAGNKFLTYDSITKKFIFDEIPLATETSVGGVKAGLGLTVATDGTMNISPGPAFYFDESDNLRIQLASDIQVGGVKLGPGVITNGDGQIVIDSAGLDFSFGDFFAFTNPGPSDGACLSSINTDQDINIVSNGSGTVNIVGTFNVHTTDDDVEGALSAPPIFSVNNLGFTKVTQMNVVNSGSLANMAALNVSINEQGLTKIPTVLGGTVAQFTGRDNLGTTVIVDTYGIDPVRTSTGGQLVFRTGNGTNQTPTAIQANDRLGQVVAAGWASNGYGGFDVGGLRILASENYTSTARGSKLELFVTNTGALTQATIATIDSTGIVLGSGKILTGSISGNANTVTHGVYTTDTGTVTNTMLAGSIANNKLANSTISGISLGSNLAALTFGTHLTGTSYNGSTGITIATDATTDATASVLVARDSNGMITGKNYKGNTRDAGTLGAGGTLTINYATDHHVFVNITGAITIAHTNITAGRNVKVVIINATGTNLSVNTGVSDINTTGNNNAANLNSNRMGTYEFISFGTTTATLYASVNK